VKNSKKENKEPLFVLVFELLKLSSRKISKHNNKLQNNEKTIFSPFACSDISVGLL
jgi:hypothetical protein